MKTGTSNLNTFATSKNIALMSTTTTGSTTKAKGVSSKSPFVKIEGTSNDVTALIHKHATRKQTGASLQTLLSTGRGDLLHKTYDEEFVPLNVSGSPICNKVATDKILMQVASFLRHELPIRLAHRIQDLETAEMMREMTSVKKVKDLYVKSFLELVSVSKQITTLDQEEEFATLLDGIYDRHAGVLVEMARGAFELRKKLKAATVQYDSMEEKHAFLDNFYLSRIGIRVLIGQYLSLRQPLVDKNYIGIICSRTNPYEIVKRAIDDASFMCNKRYGSSPEVIITGRLDLTFPYVPDHLHYIMLELIKNSMRATVDWHGIDSDYPPIRVVIADGKENEDVVIKISDEGGGILRSDMKRIWSYLFTTADPAIQEEMVSFNVNVDHSIKSPLAGLGYGLPISRSYARYFGGDISLMSMEGYGTDAFVYLTRLGNSREPLPT